MTQEERYSRFPKKGDKLTAKLQSPDFFYPHFTNMVNDGKTNIEPGKTYTVQKCDVHSSWCSVWLEEIGPSEERPDRWFNLSFFDWNY